MQAENVLLMTEARGAILCCKTAWKSYAAYHYDHVKYSQVRLDNKTIMHFLKCLKITGLFCSVFSAFRTTTARMLRFHLMQRSPLQDATAFRKSGFVFLSSRTVCPLVRWSKVAERKAMGYKCYAQVGHHKGHRISLQCIYGLPLQQHVNAWHVDRHPRVETIDRWSTIVIKCYSFIFFAPCSIVLFCISQVRWANMLL